MQPCRRNLLRLSLACACSVLLHAGAAGAPAPKVYIVVIDAMQFTPATLSVNPGDRVIWKNKDPFPHTVTAEGKAFNSGDIAAAGSWTMVAKKPGTFAYYCNYHRMMKGTLTIKQGQ